MTMKTITIAGVCLAAAAISVGLYAVDRPDRAADRAPAAAQSKTTTSVVPVTAAKVLQHDGIVD